MQILGQVTGDSLAAAWEIARSIEFEKATRSSYAPQRVERWYRFGSNLQSIPALRAKIFRNEDPHPRLVALGDRLLPGWHSLLVGAGIEPETSTSIKEHRDHGHFQANALMLNLGEAIYREQPQRDHPAFHEYHLTDGLIVLINTKLIHSAQQISPERFNFTFRQIKEQYLPSITPQVRFNK